MIVETQYYNFIIELKYFVFAISFSLGVIYLSIKVFHLAYIFWYIVKGLLYLKW